MKNTTIISTGLTHGIHISLVTLDPNEKSEKHYHKWTLEVYTLISGNGVISCGKDNQTVSSGDIVIVEPGIRHQICNTGDDTLVIQSSKNRSRGFKDYFPAS